MFHIVISPTGGIVVKGLITPIVEHVGVPFVMTLRSLLSIVPIVIWNTS